MLRDSLVRLQNQYRMEGRAVEREAAELESDIVAAKARLRDCTTAKMISSHKLMERSRVISRRNRPRMLTLRAESNSYASRQKTIRRYSRLRLRSIAKASPASTDTQTVWLRFWHLG